MRRGLGFFSSTTSLIGGKSEKNSIQNRFDWKSRYCSFLNSNKILESNLNFEENKI